jgi:hypothetical protein
VIREIFPVGKDHDRTAGGMLFLSERLERDIEPRAQVRAARLDRPWLQQAQNIDDRPEVLRERVTDHSTTGEYDNRHAVGRVGSKGAHEALGRIDRHRQSIRDRVLRAHAPADVD